VTGPRARVGQEAAALLELVERVEQLVLAGRAGLDGATSAWHELFDADDPLLAQRAVGLLALACRALGPAGWQVFRELVVQRGLAAIDSVPPL
jgi:hypothetical protein